METPDLLSLYKAILESLNFKVSNEGLLSYCYDDTEVPATLEGKRMVLPTRDVLRAGNWNELVAFHPMSENLLRGESPVLRNLKGVANWRISSLLSDLLLHFALLGNDTSRHKTVAPKAAEVLSAMPGIDDKFVDTLKKILIKQDDQGANRLVAIYLKRGGTFKGHKAARVAVVSFPILEQIEQEQDAIFGVKVRKKDLVILDSLFKYILPGADDLETYSAPSHSMSAPYFDALMRAYANVTKRINKVVELHWKTLEEPDTLMTDLDWTEAFEDLSRYDGAIPALAGNEGDVGKDEVVPTAVPAPVTKGPSMFTAAAPSAPIAQHNTKPKDDSPPWDTSHEAEEPKGPFQTSNVSAVLRQTAGPFRATTNPTAPSIQDPNKFERPADAKGDKEDYAAWLARKNRAAPTPAPQAQMQPMGQPMPMYGYQAAPQGAQPAWAVPPQPVAPGEYAGRVRGVPVTQMGYGSPTMPAWLNPVQPQQQAYGYPAQPCYPQPGYGPNPVMGQSAYPTMNVPPGGYGGGAL